MRGVKAIMSEKVQNILEQIKALTLLDRKGSGVRALGPTRRRLNDWNVAGRSRPLPVETSGVDGASATGGQNRTFASTHQASISKR